MSLVMPPEGFVVPDFEAPLDVEAHLDQVPHGATVKGVVAQSAIDAVVAAGKPRPMAGPRAFREISMRELLALKVQCAQTIYPDLPLREALRRLGRTLFPTFTSTLLGKVMYGVFGRDVASIFRLAQRSFELTQSTGKVSTTTVGPTAMRLLFSNTYTFLDSYHFGVLEGTLTACRVEGAVHLKMITPPHTGELFVAWDPAR